MDRKIELHLVGKQTDAVRLIETSLRTQQRFTVKTNFIVANQGNVQNIFNVGNARIVILSLGEDWENTLNALQAQLNLDSRQLIVVGPEHTQAMRMAMRLGARDYYSNPVPMQELNALLDELCAESIRDSDTNRNKSLVTTVINTAGGSGASFIASNLAHLFTTEHKRKVALLDMDLQFGSQALNLDLGLHYGLSEVLTGIAKLDAIALPGVFSKHRSGLHVLGEKLDDLVLPGELSSEDIEKLIDIARQAFDHTVIDLPRQIDPMFAAVMAKTDRIVLAMQQTLAHVRDAKRLLTILIQEFEFKPEHITVILNRFDEEHAITVKDIEATINHRPLTVLPNDYQRAVKATEVAKPFVEFAPNTPLARALTEVTEQLVGAPKTQAPEKTLFKRAFAAVLGN